VNYSVFVAICALAVAADVAQSAPEAVQPANQRLVLGVLEDDMQDFGMPHFRAVRTVFQKAGSDWQALPSNCENTECLSAITARYPHRLTWIVTLNGGKLGTITGQTPAKFDYYAQVGLQEIVNSGPVPTVGKRSEEFSGWGDEPVYRPLVTTSQPYYHDPESWTSTPLSSTDVKLLRKEFRRRFPRVSNCLGSNNIWRWAYPDSDMKLDKSYKSNAGWFVARVTLGDYGCDGPPDGSVVRRVFAISPKKEIRLLDDGIWLVDAGDYDNDGKSELLFAINRYDEGGYELFYDNFRRRAVFSFNYH
jgi:hypothetical protein